MNIDKPKTVRVTPVYGFGWFSCQTNEVLEVPEPFDLVVLDFKETESGTYFMGVVDSVKHEFSNRALILSLRTVWQDRKDWSVLVFESEQAASEQLAGGEPVCLCTGFAYTQGF